MNNFINEVAEKNLIFLNNLKKEKNQKDFHFLPCIEGLTIDGKAISLGFSCYMIKLLYIHDEWNLLDPVIQLDWSDYLNSYQSTNESFPDNSYIDQNLLKIHNKNNLKKDTKYLIKSVLNAAGIKKYISKKTFLEEIIFAETKQAISTLKQINMKSKFEYVTKYRTENELITYLNNLDWSKPWASGAQFANICATIPNSKENNNLINVLKDFSNSLVDSEVGGYFKNQTPSDKELINGSMKIISGLDWIDHEIHYPHKLIDTCLNISPYSEGCDLVDTVYVLFKCYEAADYKRNEIEDYFRVLIEIIQQHFHENTGGFSYYINKSQTHYYGVEISKGKNVADIHGTLLLTWAISLITQHIQPESNPFKIIKP